MIPVTTEYTNATENYRARRTEIDGLMEAVRRKLVELDAEQARDPRNWGYAGTARRIAYLLAEVAQ